MSRYEPYEQADEWMIQPTQSVHSRVAQRTARGLAACRLVVGALGVLMAAVRVSGQTPPQPPPAQPAQYLQSLGLGDSQLRAADGGQAVVRLLKTEGNHDIAVFGMIAVHASRDAVIARALALQGFVLAQASRTGVFGTPPTAADVAAVGFDRTEYKGLRNCHPSDCDFKLPASAMQSFIDGVAWSSPNAKEEADQRLRDYLLGLVSAYQTLGTAGMPTYDDGPGVRAGDAFAAVLAQSAPLLTEYAPELERYLTTYPSGRPDAAHDFVHWWEKRLPRMRPTLMVDHVVVYAPPNGTAFIARKQIYANHYFEGGLELLAVIEGEASGGAPTTYLITVRRFRFDYLPGGILNVRGRVRNHVIEGTRDDLMRERAAIERAASEPGR
jgi:hypothetical protein